MTSCGSWLLQGQGGVSDFNSGEPEPKNFASGSVLPSPVGSKLWLLLPPKTADEARAEFMERPLLPAEHLQLMGMPMYPEFAGDTYQYSWLLVLTHGCLYLLLVASGYL